MQARRWQEIAGRPIPITINLAPQQFTYAGVVDTMDQSIAETGVDPHALVLEITEDALVDDLECAREKLTPLRERGMRIMIDDFGTGYSSLGYLNELPVDIIKIAKPFVDALDAPGDDGLARAIIGIGSALGLSAVAEGVETELQVQRLRALRCDYAQGFYFGRPSAESAVIELLERSALRVA